MHISNIREGGCLERTQCSSGFGCPLCPNFETINDAVVQRHLRNHIENAVCFRDNVICRCNLPCRTGSHFHCPYCEVTIIRKANMKSHLTECQKKVNVVQPTSLASCTPSVTEVKPLSDSMVPLVSVEHSYVLPVPPTVSSQTWDHSYAQTASPKTHITQDITLATDFDEPTPPTTSDQVMIKEEEDLVPVTHLQCPHCPMILYKKNLPVHIRRKHGQLEDMTAGSHLKSVCVDQSNGIYAVKKTSRGFSGPVHVQRKTWGDEQQIRCELEDCRQYHLLVQCSEVSRSLCHHIRSVDYCSTIATDEPLQHQVLEEMVDKHFIGNSKVNVCKRRLSQAEEANVPLSVFLDICGTENKICFSVYEPELCHYSTLGRVIVTHNIQKNTWHCPCARPRTSCLHKSIAKWHLFQTHKHLFTTPPKKTTASKSAAHASHSPTADLERAVKYVFSSKKIPATPPEEVTAPRAPSDYSKLLLPDETTCQLCPDHPTLEDATRVTNKARIVGMQGVIQDVSTYNRRCPKCKLVYRYQEWMDGLHNFNDHVILTLQLCVYLRHNLQNHVSVSRVISSLESLLRVDFPATDLIFQGYCHFEALSTTEYKYSCVNCGFYPPVVVMDVHKKGVFNFEVNELAQPDNDFHGEHNIVSFWESVHLHMISRGFFQGPSQNPFVVRPTYVNWAPWIGEATRKGNTVLNTEFEKVPTKKSNGEPQLEDITKERLVHELLKLKVSAVRKLCKTCNMDTKGSRMDLINRLRGDMKSRQTFEKVFRSIWGASGGWSVIMCPHGIVYSLKFNIRAESPRDFADLLLSWKHLPNVCVYDFARGLVAHANVRLPENPPFQPFDGRLADPTSENVEAASHHKLTVHLPWLLEKLQPPEPNSHPVTGSSNHYVLYDKRHEEKTKDPHDMFRRRQVVPELQATLNSRVADELFACLRKNDYFLNNLGPSAHIFLVRNILEHRNRNENEKLLKRRIRSVLKSPKHPKL